MSLKYKEKKRCLCPQCLQKIFALKLPFVLIKHIEEASSPFIIENWPDYDSLSDKDQKELKRIVENCKYFNL